MHRFIVILIILLFHQYHLSFGQKIEGSEALEIAKKNGLVEGIEEPFIEFNNNIWTIKCLLCDENGEKYQIIEVDANTGKVKTAGRYFEMSFDGRRKSTMTGILDFKNMDSIPQKRLKGDPILLSTPVIKGKCNPAISPNNQIIAFQYDRRRIGVINIDGQGFINICNECKQPQWIDNNWIAFLKNNNQIFKKNIKTNEEKAITKTGTFLNFQISPDNKWIAYTSSDVWNTQKKDSLGFPIVHIFMNGQGQDLCLQSIDGKVKKHITKIEKRVHTPCWSENGDTLFFNIENSTYFSTEFEKDTIKYQPIRKLNSISLRDYQRKEKGLFPIKYNCKIYAIDKNRLEPRYLLIEKPDRYSDVTFSHGLEYLIYTEKEFKDSNKKIWIQKFK